MMEHQSSQPTADEFIYRSNLFQRLQAPWLKVEKQLKILRGYQSELYDNVPLYASSYETKNPEV